MPNHIVLNENGRKICDDVGSYALRVVFTIAKEQDNETCSMCGESRPPYTLLLPPIEPGGDEGDWVTGLNQWFFCHHHTSWLIHRLVRLNLYVYASTDAVPQSLLTRTQE